MPRDMRTVHALGWHDTAPRPRCPDCQARWPQLTAGMRDGSIRRDCFSHEPGYYAKRSWGWVFLARLDLTDAAERASESEDGAAVARDMKRREAGGAPTIPEQFIDPDSDGGRTLIFVGVSDALAAVVAEGTDANTAKEVGTQ